MGTDVGAVAGSNGRADGVDGVVGVAGVVAAGVVTVVGVTVVVVGAGFVVVPPPPQLARSMPLRAPPIPSSRRLTIDEGWVPRRGGPSDQGALPAATID